MTPDERLERIAELQREADEGRARIAERIARRDRDPGGELERLMADQRFTHDQSDLIYTSPVEPVGSPPARKNDEPHIIYRRYDGAQPERFPGSGAEPSGDDPSFEEAVDKFSAACETRFAELDDELAARDRRIAELERANIELKAKLDTLFQILGTGSAKKLWTP